MIKAQFNPPSIEELENFTDAVSKELKDRPLIAKIKKNESILYVGDIHGFYDNMFDAIKIAKQKSVSAVAFLGDYVDRGPQQLRSLLNVLYAYAKSENQNLKHKFDFVDPIFSEELPVKVIALRGNHEDTELNRRYGFKTELSKAYGAGNFPENLLNKLYSFLPIMVETDWKTMGVHGGIPKFENPDYADEFIKKIEKLRTPFNFTLKNISDDKFNDKLNQMIMQLLWNDPDEKVTVSRPLFSPSTRGDNIFTFNKAAFTLFLKKSGYKRLVRSHESNRGAYQALWEGMLIHIFNAYPYNGRGATPAYFLENIDGSAEILNNKGKILKKIGRI
ncbi:MAG: metallophosphoesterase [Promethearchaeota archaeon]